METFSCVGNENEIVDDDVAGLGNIETECDSLLLSICFTKFVCATAIKLPEQDVVFKFPALYEFNVAVRFSI